LRIGMSAYRVGRTKAEDTRTEEAVTVLGELEYAVAENRILYGTPSKLFWRSLQSIRLEVEHVLGGHSWSTAAQLAQAALESYWLSLQRRFGAALPFVPFEAPQGSEWKPVPDNTIALTLARGLGRLASQSEPLTAGYWLGEVYTQLLPTAQRAQYGVFYTPPALTQRLLTSLQQYGVDWRTARVIDPACGGGAFLSPVALEQRRALAHLTPHQILAHIAGHLHGYEVDAFGAWMSQVMLEATLYDLCTAAEQRLPSVVETIDALGLFAPDTVFDVVVGNPPYGRITLPPELRAAYARSVYGHANLYGLFMDLAVRLVGPGGLIALVTPTSFLGGQYFRKLRSLMMHVAPPIAIDLVSSRKGVFTDVLQETLLAIYKHDANRQSATVSVVELLSESEAEIEATGDFSYPPDPHEPWLLPRHIDQSALVERIRAMPHRLKDYGYKVSTGPLVWNRHKPQLLPRKEIAAYPIVWAESITRDGQFIYRTGKRNHAPFLQLHAGDEWLITRQGCILVQRTTAKEQHRRLIAAELPTEFIAQHGGVSVENHLNMVRPICDPPPVSAKVVTALLNSTIVDQAFRCISGSVAVSASELASLPLPPPEQAQALHKLIEQGITTQQLDHCIYELYMTEPIYAGN
jgi:adenine-specific DNA-methyltransferase